MIYSQKRMSKKAKRELFKGFIRALEKQDGLIEEFNAGIWSSLVQEVIVKAKDDIRFIFKNGFEVKVPKNQDSFGKGRADSELKVAYQKSGISHVLAISGVKTFLSV